MGFRQEFANLCPPALIYFIVSTFALVMCILQNLGSRNGCKIGLLVLRGNPLIMIIIKMIFILIWTWILSLICRAGYVNISWFLILAPFILMLIVASMVMQNSF